MITLKWMKLLTFFFLSAHKFMHKLHLREQGFTYSACETFTTSN